MDRAGNVSILVVRPIGEIEEHDWLRRRIEQIAQPLSRNEQGGIANPWEGLEERIALRLCASIPGTHRDERAGKRKPELQDVATVHRRIHASDHNGGVYSPVATVVVE